MTKAGPTNAVHRAQTRKRIRNRQQTNRENRGALIAGSGEVGGLLLQEFGQLAPKVPDHPTDLMAALRQHARQRYGEWFPSLPPVPPMALVQAGQIAPRPDLSFLVGGIDQASGDAYIYQLTSMTDFSPMLHDYGFAVAGVAQYALYLLNRLYQPDRSIDDLVALAVYAITETGQCSFQPSTVAPSGSRST